MLRLLVDENIPFAHQAFPALGDVRLVPGRTISPAMLQDIDVLLVRSVTTVNAALLDKTPVRFVGTTTIGVDHMDVNYLRRQGIVFASAAGSNANSVAEYVVAAIVHHACERQLRLSDVTIGVVGVGNIGIRVVKCAQALGLHVLQNDPPRQRSETSADFVSLDQLMNADIISLHTPLTMAGEDATFHLFDARRLAQMESGSLLINTARGGVADTAALRDILSRGRLFACLDVWENEPEIDGELLEQVSIGTAHIAGYSYQGKVNGTYQVYEALCHFLHQQPEWQPQRFLRPVPSTIKIAESSSLEENLRRVIAAAYDIAADSRRLKVAARLTQEERGKYFDELRKSYPVRREFFGYRVVAKHLSEEALQKLQALGFEIRYG